MKYLKRNLETTFLEMSDVFKCVLVLGARQVGKSTMLKHLCENQQRSFVTMDDASERELAKNDPELFFQAHPTPILIDEVQKAPELLEQIKIMCDESDERGRFWLTGSQRSRLMEKSRETLVGRLGLLNLSSLSLNEIEKVKARNLALDYSYESLSHSFSDSKPYDATTIFSQIIKGGYPDAQDLSSKMRHEYFNSYVENYLIADAVNDQGVSDVANFRRFIRACAALSSQMLNYKFLAETVGISQATAKNWTKALEDMGVIYFLEPFSNNYFKRLSRTPKIYFCDTGLCAHLTGWNEPNSLFSGPFAGAIFETFAVMEFAKHLTFANEVGKLSYFRDQNKKEIDLLLERNGRVSPFEIKLNARPNTREVRKFSVLEEAKLNVSAGGIICLAQKPFPIDKNNCYIPVGCIG